MINSNSISQSFTTLQSWADAHAPGVSFRPPADPAAIVNFIEKSALPFPDDLYQLLLQADGETNKSAGIIGNWRLMPIAEIQAAWGYLTQITEKGAFEEYEPKSSPYMRRAWWHPGWIPIVSSDTGHYFCLDTDPPEPERKGQVILFLKDQPERYLVAGSLGAWLAQIIKDLDDGLYSFDPVEGFNEEAFMRSALEGKHVFDGKGPLIAES